MTVGRDFQLSRATYRANSRPTVALSFRLKLVLFLFAMLAVLSGSLVAYLVI